MNILLQILDEGKTNDAHGRTVSFANTVIIMTSNAGSERKAAAMGFGKEKGEVRKEMAIKALREFLRPEFIGRVDEIVVFNELGEPEYCKIAGLMLGELKEALQDKGITLSWTEDVLPVLVHAMDGDVRGARDLRNVIRRKVEDKVSSYLVEHCDEPLREIKLTVADNDVHMEVK